MNEITGCSSADVPADWTRASKYVNSDDPAVAQFTAKALQKLPADADQTVKAICLFNAVRDDIRYDPYQMGFDDQEYKASFVATLPAAYCVPKAILLAACLRHTGIAAGVGFADVKNHLNSPKLAEMMETDLFMYHGYVALRLGDQSFKVTPTFNRELCDRFGVQAIEFDGKSDALFHEYDAEKRQHMEYVKDRGIFEDPPMPDIIEDFGRVYPKIKRENAKKTHAIHDPDFAA